MKQSVLSNALVRLSILSAVVLSLIVPVAVPAHAATVITKWDLKDPPTPPTPPPASQGAGTAGRGPGLGDEDFTLQCATSGSHTFALSGGPTSFTLNPDSDFASCRECTVTVLAAQVTDQDGIDPPDNMLTDHSFSFATVASVIPAQAGIHPIVAAAQSRRSRAAARHRPAWASLSPFPAA